MSEPVTHYWAVQPEPYDDTACGQADEGDDAAIAWKLVTCEKCRRELE